VKDVRRFSGLEGYYRRFVKKFGIISRSLFDLLKMGAVLVWTQQSEEAFESLKIALITALVLALPNFQEPFR
jgi:hypothetical protein